MAPYNPPNTHYSQIDVSEYRSDDIWNAIGAKGKGFYHLTNKLHLKYIWYDSEKQIVELWGPYMSFKNGAADKLLHSIRHKNQFKRNSF